jgi:phage baseplate assembly protein W
MSTDPVGLLIPFRRDRKRDFASGAGEDLLVSKVLQALLTEGATPQSSGELPWRTSFGSGLHVLRHLRNEAALADLARVYVRDCLKRWVPEAELVGVTATRDGATLQLKVRFRAAKDAGKAATTSAVQVSLEG